MNNTDQYTFLCRTKTSFGKNALDHLPFDLSSMGARKPFVIQEKQAMEADCTQALIQAFKESGMVLGVWPAQEMDAEPRMDTLKQCYQTFIDKGFDSIIALGTSRIVDLAKALNLAVSCGPDVLKQKTGNIKAPPVLQPMAYIPTSTGTGWETDRTARFNDQVFDLPVLGPDIALIDKRCLGEAKLDHVVNSALSCFAVSSETLAMSQNPMANAYASAAIKLVIHHLYPLFESVPYSATALIPRDKKNQDHFAALIQASTITGVLLANSKSLICVELGEILYREANISKGKVMAMILPSILETFTSDNTRMDALLLSLLGQDGYSTIPVSQHSVTAIQHLRGMLNTLYRLSAGSISRTLDEAGVGTEHLETVMDAVQHDKTAEKINLVLTHSMSGQPLQQA